MRQPWERRMPTWSWCSINGEIIFGECGDGNGYFIDGHATILGCQYPADIGADIWQLKSATLTLKGQRDGMLKKRVHSSVKPA
jgi:hypothetical protein